MIYFNKILPIFVLPLGITIILMLAGLVLQRRALVWLSLAVLWASSTPLVSANLMRAAEGWVERPVASEVATADAIVVLGGRRIIAPGASATSEWSDADRYFGGVELFQLGKAPLLVFTGAPHSWQPDSRLEGDVLKRYAIAMGIPGDKILTTGRVLNTAEEAAAVSALLHARQVNPAHVLLVTSAYHMPRAQALFERAGLVVTPFPVDFKVSSEGRLDALDLLPRAQALEQTQTAIREVYGRLFYWAVSLL
jgi:uncharacterized SAM-binding protein YcdF (DUF218 family)